MRAFFIILCGLFALKSSVFSQCYFHNLYRYQSGDWFDAGLAITTQNNGNILAPGFTDISSTNEAVVVIKVNQCGDTLWTKKYDYRASGGEYGNTILPFNDKFIVTGVRSNLDVGAREGFVLYIDTSGMSLYDTSIYLGYNGLHNSAILDDGYILTAGHFHNNLPNAQAFLAKTDSLGNIIWSRSYGDSITGYRYPTLIKVIDGGYLLSGRISAPPNSNWFVIKTDSAGNLQWEKKFLWSPLMGFGYSIPTADSNYMIVGFTQTSISSASDAHIAKINASGDTLWTKTYGIAGYNEVFKFIKQLPEGSFIVAGGKREPADNGYYIWIVKLNEQGNIIWQRQYSYYGGATDNYEEDMTITLEGDIALTGYIIACPGVPSHTTGNDMFILKVDSCGYLENQNINAAFAYSLDTLNKTVLFSNQSTEYCTALWYFGDGDSVYQKNATHRYTTPGSYTITLIVRAGNSLGTVQQQVNISDSCGYVSSSDINAAFTFSIDSFTVSFMNLSEDYCTSQWYFGDGNGSGLLNPAHSYADTGKYIVTLIVKAGVSENIMLRQIHITTPIIGMNTVQAILNDIFIYPNPANETIHVSLPATRYSIRNISISDISGKEILNTTHTEISISSLAGGLYFVRVELENGESAVRKVVVQ